MAELIYTLFMNVLLPSVVSRVAAVVPFFGTVTAVVGWFTGIPVIGPWLLSVAENFVRELIKEGVINIKWEVLDKLSSSAKRGYEPMIAMLREAQTREFLSEEEEAEYERRLKEVVRNRPGVVGA